VGPPPSTVISNKLSDPPPTPRPAQRPSFIDMLKGIFKK
jgi:hypothetical protein